MTGKIATVHLQKDGHKPSAITRQLSAPNYSKIPKTVTSPGNLQCSLEFWIQSETTPLLPKVPLPTKGDYVFTSSFKDSKSEEDGEESSISIACQVFIPFMIAGFGTVAAGLLLDFVQDWNVFQQVPEMFVLVPALLGLKGNLEMTLASRISTLANLGSIDTTREQWRMAFGNVCLLQCQSLVLGIIASIFASVVGWIREGQLNFSNVLLLSSCSLVTASIASFILGSLTIFVVVFSRKVNINPDNIAAPIAASLGDVVTLALLSFISSSIFSRAGTCMYIESAVLIALICLIPLWGFLSYKNTYTQHVLYSGWIPIISAVAISSGGGYILNFAVARYSEIAACQPVINGVGGNLVAVQACRISTYLHRHVKAGIPSNEKLCVSPFVAWFGKNVHARTCRILLLLAVPGHLIFISCVNALKGSTESLTFQFLLLYISAAILQVALLLYISHCFVPFLRRWGFDPDDAAIPYLTALGDLAGTGLLLVAFLLMDVW